MVDEKELGEGAARGVGFLSGENGVTEPRVVCREELLKEGAVKEVSRLVEAQSARREGGDDALSFGFEKFLGEGVEVGEVKISVEAVEGEEERHPGLGVERGDTRGVEKTLGSPEVDAAVTDVAHERGAAIESVEDGAAAVVDGETTEVDFLGVSRREKGGSELVGVGVEVAGVVGIVGDEDHGGGRGRGVGFVADDFVDEDASLVEARRRELSDGEVGKRILAVDGGVGGVGGGPEVGGPCDERRDVVADPGLEMVSKIVGCVPEEDDVAELRPAPVMVGIGEKLVNRFGARLTESEGGVDLFDGDGFAEETLSAAQLDERLGGREELPGSDDQVLGSLGWALERLANGVSRVVREAGRRKRRRSFDPEKLGGRRDIGHSNDQEDQVDVGAKKGDDQEDENELGKRLHELEEEAHRRREALGPEAGENAEEGAEEKTHPDGKEAREKKRLGPDHGASEEVAAHEVGPQKVARARELFIAPRSMASGSAGRKPASDRRYASTTPAATKTP
jgi:hypothetical protein